LLLESVVYQNHKTYEKLPFTFCNSCIAGGLARMFAEGRWKFCTKRKRCRCQCNACQNSDAEKLAAKRTARTKARLEKEEQRRLAVLAKAGLSPTYSDLKGNVVYYKAEVDPAYTGGMEGLETYLKANLIYPTGAREKGLEGTVFVDFVIDTRGRVREVVASDVVGEDVDASFKEESVRVVAGMPAWNPGRQHGIAVDAAFSIPITFQLENWPGF
jgi:TonB family protein